MKKIIFICTGNTCRSPMAMAVCNRMFEENGISDWVADSAGLAAGYQKMSDNSAKVLEEIGIFVSDFLSKPLSFEMINEAEILSVMTSGHKNALISAGISEDKIRILGDGIPDPYGGSLEDYRKCLTEIKSGVELLFKEGVFN